MREDGPGDGLALYLHWPFCLSKCPYCDFNSHVRDGVDQARWRAALVAEIAHFAAQTPGRRLTSIFFGGGTPSLMPPDTVAAAIAAARGHWQFADDIEITLEANPGASDAARFAAFAAAGVNRISIGVQSFDDDALKFLGRIHAARDGIAAIEAAQRAVARTSFDLIYALPGQTRTAWRAQLDHALGFSPDHLSVYQLTIEKGTPFHAAWRRGALAVMDEDAAAELFELTGDVLGSAGLPAYEISNHAAPGAESRHNLAYWTGGEYVGAGPGAHGRLGLASARRATEQIPGPEAWLASVERDGHGTRAERPVDPQDRLAELTMTGLRLTGGIARETFAARLGAPPERLFEQTILDRLTSGGFLVLDEAGLRATAAGRLRLNAVVAALTAS